MRKGVDYGFAPPDIIMLQWGRNLTVAEGVGLNVSDEFLPRLQWGRNLTVAEGGQARTRGAPARGASMGPQLDSCGRVVRVGGRVLKFMWLQWGRNLTVAEGGTQCRVGAQACDASMGPQLDSCGRHDQLVPRHDGGVASMGPQLDSCGRRRVEAPLNVAPPLQWGRNLTVAEGPYPSTWPACRACFNGAAT